MWVYLGHIRFSFSYFYCIRAITLRVILWRASGIPPPSVWRVVVVPPVSKVARCMLIGCVSRKEKTGASSGARINGGRTANMSSPAVKPVVKQCACHCWFGQHKFFVGQNVGGCQSYFVSSTPYTFQHRGAEAIMETIDIMTENRCISIQHSMVVDT